MSPHSRPHVTHLVVTDGFAGVERYVTTVAAESARRGWTVRVLGGREADMRRELPDSVQWAPAPTVRRAALALARSPRPDVVHVHMTAAEIAAGLVPRRVPLVSTRHFAAPRGSGPAARFAGRLAARRLAGEVAISDAVRTASGTPSMPVVLTGVPCSAIPRDPQRTVVVAQRLESEKRTGEAIEAFAASGLAEAGWTVEVYGEGSEAAALEALAAGLGLSGTVTLHGYTTAMPDVLARAGIVVATTPHEGFGLAVAEAMAAGAPVVAAAAGGHLETLGAAPGGRLYPVGDVLALSRTLAALGGASEDERATYGADLRSWQRAHLSIESHVDRLADVYRAATTRRH